MSQHNTQVVRFDGRAFVDANKGLVERNIRLLSRMDGLKPEIRKDTNLTAFLARQLVHVRGQIEHTIYERVRAAEFVPVEGGHPRGATNYATQRMEHVGEAKISVDMAGDSPRADAQVSEDFNPYANVRASYAYTVQDLEQSAMAGVPLPQWKAEACADIIARGIDKIGREGDAKVGLTGFFNNANVTVKTLTNGEWVASATVDEILADLNEIETTIITASGDTAGMFGPHTLVLPTAQEGKLATTARASGSDMSIKEWFLKNNRGLITSIERYEALTSATGSQVAAADPPQGICYPKNPLVLFWPHAISYEEQAPQLQNWEWSVSARARVGGVEFRRPTHCLYVENLD